ncbi:MAG: short-chain fatty acyl-CoA regulator family protein [Pseudomonadota bacterium]
MKRNILGPRIRERRRDLGVTQAAMAGQLEISASYLNLIEHNKRDIGGALLGKIARALDLPLEELDGAADRRLMEVLEEVSQSPELLSLGIEKDSVGELIGRFPGWARGIVALSRSEHQATNIAQVLGDRLNHDPFLGETVHKMLSRIASLYSAAEIVNGFPDINSNDREKFANIIHEESQNLSELGDALAGYFDNSAWAKRTLTPLDEVDEYFDQRNNHFSEIESRADRLFDQLPQGPASVRHPAARNLVKRKLDKILQQMVTSEPLLETEIARDRALITLKTYATHAVLAPTSLFRQHAVTLKYDIEQLADTFGVDFDVICERLSALSPDDDQPQFGYHQTNASGSFTRSRNLPGLMPPRYGAACPLWILYRAQQTPFTVLRQQVQIPSGETYVFVARAKPTGKSGFREAKHYLTDMCVFSLKDAAKTVYAPEASTPIEPVGLSCRTCSRNSCEHRVADPMTG